MFSMQSFIDCPDYYGSDGSFTNPRRVTDANPQQVEYSWGHSVLLDYTNKDGVRLQAALAIPDSRKGNERMPMLVSFYEKSAHRLHKYVSPAYAYSSWSVQMEMISKGYMMLAPDVHFRVGSTDEDMLECVEAAVDKAIELGYADPDRIGLCGHSFSGAGAVYIATRSKKFAAVSAGAGSVEPGMFHYLWGYSADRKTGAGENAHHCETYGQCRMGLLPVEDWESYRSESAIDCVPKMTTSLLLMQGESDDIVAWADAIFIYNAMRLHGKKIILLSYPKEGHSLAKRVNRVDFTNRVMEFFDHHLKGKPAPDWITKGVPFLDKESS
jgi:dipeptidyl aminopeptidase/acylaminoacyl peptidase